MNYMLSSLMPAMMQAIIGRAACQAKADHGSDARRAIISYFFARVTFSDNPDAKK
jgi:hypothetical protein